MVRCHFAQSDGNWIAFLCLVFEILLAYVQNHDWEKAFTCVIPERKVLTKKLVNDEEPEPSSDASDSGTV